MAIRAMLSGVSGLRTHSTRMDVIGNDIANVNTTGYKQSDVTFKESLIQSLRTPAAGTPGQQIGLGVQLGTISKNFKEGSLLETGQTPHVGISGEGFFVVADPGGAGQTYYTRAGDFVHDFDAAAGGSVLINSAGKQLMGVLGANPDATGVAAGDLVPIVLPAGTDSYTIGNDGVITATINGGAPEVIGRIPLATFENNFGLIAEGSNLFTEGAANPRAFTNAGEGGAGNMFQGFLENSNVDLAQEFTDMIVTQRGFQANSRSITTGDEMLQEVIALKR